MDKELIERVADHLLEESGVEPTSEALTAYRTEVEVWARRNPILLALLRVIGAPMEPRPVVGAPRVVNDEPPTPAPTVTRARSGS